MKLKEHGGLGYYVEELPEILNLLGVKWISVDEVLPSDFIYTRRPYGKTSRGVSKDLIVTDGEIVYKSCYVENVGFAFPSVFVDINVDYYPSDDVTYYAYVEDLDNIIF